VNVTRPAQERHASEGAGVGVSSVDAQAWQPPGHWRISCLDATSVLHRPALLFPLRPDVATSDHHHPPSTIQHPPTSSFPPDDIRSATSVLATSCIASNPTRSFQHVPVLFHLKRPTVPRFRRDLLDHNLTSMIPPSSQSPQYKQNLFSRHSISYKKRRIHLHLFWSPPTSARL
jgi:hypothetical protein